MLYNRITTRLRDQGTITIDLDVATSVFVFNLRVIHVEYFNIEIDDYYKLTKNLLYWYLL